MRQHNWLHNLIKEGKNPDTIFITGNTVIDAMRHTVIKNYTHPELTWVGENKLIFITAHRRENLGEPMQHMFRAIRKVLEKHHECKAVYPIHMNPAVRQMADEELRDCKQIHIIEPLDVIDCHNFEARSFLCLTDSGGNSGGMSFFRGAGSCYERCNRASGRSRRRYTETGGNKRRDDFSNNQGTS